MAYARYTVLGIMSGSSLDGIDLAVCTFSLDPTREDPVGSWSIDSARTIPYPPEWRQRLLASPMLGARELEQLDAALGRWIGERAGEFLSREASGHPFLVGCHGHTVFHDPSAGYSLQLGDGAALASGVKLPVITELRSADIAAGGQGAPLAPVADRHLFPGYSAFLNLGGIVNFSVRRKDGTFLAGDLSGCCQIMDRLAAETGRSIDEDGQLARSGEVIPELLEKLYQFPFHDQPCPKSLSNQWVVDTLWPILKEWPGKVADRLRTFVEFLADTILQELDLHMPSSSADIPVSVLVTGGGARNKYLMERLRSSTSYVFDTPEIVGDFKEAALVALCALLRWNQLPNSLATATGAERDTINGALYAG